MPNPFGAIYRYFLPKFEKDETDIVQHKMIATVELISFLALSYSVLKWGKLGYDSLADACLVLVFTPPLLLFANKYRAIPVMLLANAVVLKSIIHGALIVYFLGGINSPHIFWPVCSAILAYLITDNKFGLMWFGVISFFMLFLMIGDQTGYEFPHFELDEKQSKINFYSGYGLPIVCLGYVLWFGNTIRSDAILATQNAMLKAQKHSDHSEMLMEHLTHILEGATSSVSTLVNASTELTDTMQEMVQQSGHINDRLERQSQSTSSMNITLNSTADSVSDASVIIDEVKNEAQNAEKDVQESSQSMSTAIEYMSNIKNSNDSILTAMNIISDIANQTNLLALNAAIEASRAGDQGRGFAVVADEVRSLSTRSNDSTQTIKKILEKATDDIAQGAAVVNIAGERLDSAVISVQTIAQRLGMAVELTAAQLNNIQGVVKESKQVYALIQESSQSAEQLIKSTDSLQSVAVGLNKLAQQTSEKVHAADNLS